MKNIHEEGHIKPSSNLLERIVLSLLIDIGISTLTSSRVRDNNDYDDNDTNLLG